MKMTDKDRQALLAIQEAHRTMDASYDRLGQGKSVSFAKQERAKKGFVLTCKSVASAVELSNQVRDFASALVDAAEENWWGTVYKIAGVLPLLLGDQT